MLLLYNNDNGIQIGIMYYKIHNKILIRNSTEFGRNFYSKFLLYRKFL